MADLYSGRHAVRVAIRCDRRLCRDALASRISGEPGFTVAGHVAGDADLLSLCRLSTPDVVLFDACADGVPAAAGTLGELRTRFARTRIVVIYEQLAPEDRPLDWPAGDTLVPCSRGLDAVLVELRRFATEQDTGRTPPKGDLTEQERRILTLIAAGHPVTGVAANLGVSPRTVDNCKRRAYLKLDVANQSQAIARAAALGLLYPAPAARFAARPGRPLAVLRGPKSPERERASAALLAGGVPFVIEPNGSDHTGKGEDGGPVLHILVDPPSGVLPTGAAAPTLVIRSTPMRGEEAIGLLRHGVVGLIAPDSIENALVPALTLAASGHLTVDPAVAGDLLSATGRTPVAENSQLPHLTAREEDILRSIAAGDTVRQTARALGIAPKTVENIQARLFRKLGVRNRPGAVAVAHTLGLLGPASR